MILIGLFASIQRALGTFLINIHTPLGEEGRSWEAWEEEWEEAWDPILMNLGWGFRTKP